MQTLIDLSNLRKSSKLSDMPYMSKVIYFWLILLLVVLFTSFFLEDEYSGITIWIYISVIIVSAITFSFQIWKTWNSGEESISDEELTKYINEKYDKNK